MLKVYEFIEKINSRMKFIGQLRFDEPLAAHTTFKVGGPADLWIRPEGEGFPAYAAALTGAAKSEGIPLFILGGGANVVVADRGVRGIVLDTGGWTGAERGEEAGTEGLVFRSGTPVDAAVEEAAERGLGGLEFLAGMPGSVGGAVWMNARAYEKSLSDILIETEILAGPAGGTGETPESAGTPERRVVPRRAEDFGYKKSPFQGGDALILSARFRLYPDSEGRIREEMESRRRDREAKGHYRFPSAGSAFKNSREFGKPAGKIIDELGLRGFAIGGARIAPWHGNIIINTGGATAEDIRALVRETAARVEAALGFTLEPEILFAGEW
jgi:UDP-N-acetylmuramate dehydrogenase